MKGSFPVRFLILIFLIGKINAQTTVAYTLVAKPSLLQPGAKAVFTLEGKPDVTDFTLAADPSQGLTCAQHTCTAPKPPDGDNGKLAVAGLVTATATFNTNQTASTTVTLTSNEFEADERGPWEAHAIIGYHQSGAASANFAQNVIMDLYLVRPLSRGGKAWEARFNSWGNVRIASAPRQLNTPFVSLLQGLVVGGDNSPLNTNVNELALSAEFQTGIEYNMTPHWNGKTLGLIGFFGATGAFESPDKSIRIYQVPETQSPQYPLFKAQFPAATGSTYIGFVTPDRDRFYRQYGVGFRYSRYHPSRQYESPQTFTWTVGQDELITGGRLRSVVTQFDGFYPLPVNQVSGRYQFLYIFGTVTLRLSRGENNLPLVLASAPPTIKGTENSVAIVSTPSNRDTYRIGIGADLVNLIRSALQK
jgi:hypothetical protein